VSDSLSFAKILQAPESHPWNMLRGPLYGIHSKRVLNFGELQAAVLLILQSARVLANDKTFRRDPLLTSGHIASCQIRLQRFSGCLLQFDEFRRTRWGVLDVIT
jgi:hypothetical protein